MDTLRLFIAISLPEPLREDLTRLQHTLDRQMPSGSVRWVRPDSIHLTLKFLGDTSVGNVSGIQEALAAVARNATACQVLVLGLGCFPNPRRPRVVWVGLEEPTGRLFALQQAIEEAMAALGYPAEGRAFTPHLTVGRVQRQASTAEVQRVGEVVAATELGIIGRIEAIHIHLIRSVLKPSGAEYTTLVSASLREP